MWEDGCCYGFVASVGDMLGLVGYLGVVGTCCMVERMTWARIAMSGAIWFGSGMLSHVEESILVFNVYLSL